MGLCNCIFDNNDEIKEECSDCKNRAEQNAIEECDLEDRGYTNERFKQFIRDMHEAGFTENVRHYQGRWFYEGPACYAADNRSFQEVIRATKIALKWDDMGLGIIIYPG